MKKRKTNRIISIILAAMMLLSVALPVAAIGTESKTTNFITGQTDIDELLKRDYIDNVPLGYSEDLFSLYQPGWGFDRNDVYRTGIAQGVGMPVSVSFNGSVVSPANAEFTPSYVSSEYVYDGEETTQTVEVNLALNAYSVYGGAEASGYPRVDASFAQMRWGRRLEQAFDGSLGYDRSNWNTYRANDEQGDDFTEYPVPEEGDWTTIEFEKETSLDKIRVHAFKDNANVALPKSINIQYWNGTDWTDIEHELTVETDSTGCWYNMTFDSITAIKFKISAVADESPDKQICIGFDEIEYIQYREVVSSPISIKGYKYISPDSSLNTIIEAENIGSKPAEITVSASMDGINTVQENMLTGSALNFQVSMAGGEGFEAANGRLTKSVTLQPGEKAEFRIAAAFSDTVDENTVKLSGYLEDSEPLTTQKAEFNQWFIDSIPYVDMPDEQIKQIYYFRWYTYRNHIRNTPEDYYIISEFLPNVGWAGKYNSINCPMGFHVAEGRWIKNNEYLDDYLTHWMDKGGAIRSYSTWIADAYYNRYLVNQDDYVLDYVDKLAANYEAWDDHYTPEVGMYWQNNDRDGMENSIAQAQGGTPHGYRTTLNSYMYADAMALSKFYTILGNTETAGQYEQEANALKATVDEKLWDSKDGFYKVIPYKDGTADPNGLVAVKEEIGFIPWMFNMADDTEEYARAWQYVMDPEYFMSEYGLRTAEKQYARITPDGEYGTGICRWDGPVWPFATSQTLVAMANVLNNYNNQNYIDAEDYYTVLKQYADSQYKNGAPWIAEDLDGDTGRWIADEKRSPNYNHSEYADLIISGLMGIRPREDDILEINPLIPEGRWDWFCLENVEYHGKNITILYDKDGTKYGQGAGYKVYVDGKIALEQAQPGHVEISLSDSPITAPASAYEDEKFEISVNVGGLLKGIVVRNENGSKIGAKTAAISDNGDGTYTATVEMSVGTAADGRTFTVYNGVDEIGTFTINILNREIETGIKSINAPETAAAGETFRVTAVSSKDLKNYHFENESGNKIGAALVSRTVYEGLATAEYDMNIGTPGSRTISLKMALSGSTEWNYSSQFGITIS